METLGDRVKAIRQREGLSQLEFAEKMGMAGPTISLIEKKGTASLDTVDAVSKHYKVEKEWLLTGEGAKPKGVIVVPIRKELDEGPWKDFAVQRMQGEIEFLKEVIRNLTQGKGTAKENFLNALSKASKSGKVVPMHSATGILLGVQA